MTASATSLLSALLGFGLPGGYEWVILLILGLLIFGRRLPEVGRSLGRGIVEFKRGIKGIDSEIESESSRPSELEHQTTPAPAPRPKSAARPQPRLNQERPAGAVSRSAAEAENAVEASSADEPDRDEI